MLDDLDFYAAKAALEWQLDCGVDETIGEQPVNRYEVSASNIKPVSVMPAMPSVEQSAPEIARLMAGQCQDLTALRSAMGVFEHCALKKGARNLVFSDGTLGARIMVIGEAPGRDEDIQGLPFVGRAGQLLDKMFAAIDHARDRNLYITNVMPWRPPQNRDPSKEEIAMMLPFLERHVALAAPDLIVLMGNTACQAVLGKSGITKLRGTWAEAFGKPVMPMFHPAALLRDPSKKKDAWSDLRTLKAKLHA